MGKLKLFLEIANSRTLIEHVVLYDWNGDMPCVRYGVSRKMYCANHLLVGCEGVYRRGFGYPSPTPGPGQDPATFTHPEIIINRKVSTKATILTRLVLIGYLARVGIGVDAIPGLDMREAELPVLLQAHFLHKPNYCPQFGHMGGDRCLHYLGHRLLLCFPLCL
jgi:hypothetical protein